MAIDDKSRKERYQLVRQTVNYNSGYHKPVAPMTVVRGIVVGQMDLSKDLFRSHLKAACDNGDLVRGSGYVWHPEESGEFGEAIEWVAQEADDPREFVSAMNRWRSEQ